MVDTLCIVVYCSVTDGGHSSLMCCVYCIAIRLLMVDTLISCNMSTGLADTCRSRPTLVVLGVA